MKRGDTFDIVTRSGPLTVTALPMRYPTFGDAYEAREIVAEKVPCVLTVAGLEVAVCAPVEFADSFKRATSRFKKIPRRGARLRMIVERVA